MYTFTQVYEAYHDACDDIDVEKNQEIIIEGKNSEYAYLFARHIKNANLERLQQVVIDSKDIYYIFAFAVYVKGADIQKLSEVVFNSGDEYWIKAFYEDIPHDKFNVSKFETYLTFM